MGLFDKKTCDICGEKIGLLGNRKLDDGNLCKNCASKLSPWFEERRHSTVEDIKRQLAYREENKNAVRSFSVTREFSADRYHVFIDDNKGMFAVAFNMSEQDNPDIVPLSAITSCRLDIDEQREEEEYTDQDGESSFAILQDILRENDCQAGIAFLGYIGYDASTEEILNYTNQEDHVASYPFLKNGTVVDAGGYEVFAIVPASDWSINVYSSEMTEDAVYKDYLDFPLYEGSPDEVIILRCNLSEIYSNTMVTSKEGNMSVTYRPSISLKDGHLAEEQHCYDFSIYNDYDYGHNGSDNCMESNLPEDYYEDYYSDTVQNAYELLCSTDEVSYYLGLGFFVWYTGNKDIIDDKECRVFVLGKDIDDHIEVKNHYAVSDEQVYYLDVIENTWNILGAG